MIARYSAALTSGTLMTLVLLYAMQSLIHLQPGAGLAVPDRKILEWLTPPRTVEPPRVEELPIDPEILKNAPVPPTGPTTPGQVSRSASRARQAARTGSTPGLRSLVSRMAP